MMTRRQGWILALLIPSTLLAQGPGLIPGANQIKNAVEKSVVEKATSKKTNLSNEEIINGLKEALRIGTEKSVAKLSALNGFFNNPLLKIPMPPETKKIETTLRTMGMGNIVDKAILAMNRAAEDASKSVVQIFVGAITKMTISDGLKILQGDDGAATAYLRQATSQELNAAILPIVTESLKKVEATKYWNEVFTAYNKVAKAKVDVNLANYVTAKAVNGLFIAIRSEEQRIRKDPAAQVTDLLKKVFGS